MKRYDPKQLNQAIVSNEPFVTDEHRSLDGDTLRFTPVSGDTQSFEPIRSSPSDVFIGDTMRVKIPDAQEKTFAGNWEEHSSWTYLLNRS